MLSEEHEDVVQEVSEYVERDFAEKTDDSKGGQRYVMTRWPPISPPNARSLELTALEI